MRRVRSASCERPAPGPGVIPSRRMAASHSAGGPVTRRGPPGACFEAQAAQAASGHPPPEGRPGELASRYAAQLRTSSARSPSAASSSGSSPGQEPDRRPGLTGTWSARRALAASQLAVIRSRAAPGRRRGARSETAPLAGVAEPPCVVAGQPPVIRRHELPVRVEPASHLARGPPAAAASRRSPGSAARPAGRGRAARAAAGPEPAGPELSRCRKPFGQQVRVLSAEHPGQAAAGGRAHRGRSSGSAAGSGSARSAGPARAAGGGRHRGPVEQHGRRVRRGGLSRRRASQESGPGEPGPVRCR